MLSKILEKIRGGKPKLIRKDRRGGRDRRKKRTFPLACGERRTETGKRRKPFSDKRETYWS